MKHMHILDSQDISAKMKTEDNPVMVEQLQLGTANHPDITKAVMMG